MTIKRLLIPCALLAALLPVGARAQQAPAIPTTVKSILKTPPKQGQLLQVSGFLLVGDKETRLLDVDHGRRVTLDFSKSTTTPESLGATGAVSPPVLVIGRMQGMTDNGKPVIAVIGALNLTP